MVAKVRVPLFETLSIINYLYSCKFYVRMYRENLHDQVTSVCQVGLSASTVTVALSPSSVHRAGGHSYLVFPALLFCHRPVPIQNTRQWKRLR